MAQEIVDTHKLIREKLWPHGSGPNRKALEALFRSSCDQKLSNSRPSSEDLFHPSTLHPFEG